MPDLNPLSATFALLDYAGVAVFAASGALAAARYKHTIVTFAFFAAVTGVGGGTLRDLLIGAPVFWVQNQLYLAVCLGMALLVWVTRADRWPAATLLWLDAAGMAVYAVVGAAKAMSYGVPPLPCMVMGVLTASFGGIVRDVLANEPSILLRPEIYLSAAALAATVFLVLAAMGLPPLIAGAIGAAAGFVLRAGALRFGWTLPGYRRV
ncbi:trimeric intracellular cation channel family protein [Sphingoaurantiacus capsulatus]|uniref:Trimeric intracellular cation channel family protein n=1 Tax=Sphingoaurantiacus capsulatus TaxID=1771310 RepID=A0ABV7XFI8_9SPHN